MDDHSRTWIQFPPSPRVQKSARTKVRAIFVRGDGEKANCFAFVKLNRAERCVFALT